MKKYSTESLEIGLFLKEQINPLIPVYPVMAGKETPFPFATYRRTGFRPKDSKDRSNYEETVNLEIAVYSKHYAEGLGLAAKIKDRLEKLRGKWRDLVICGITMTDADEGWGSEVCVQRLFFSIDLDNQ